MNGQRTRLPADVEIEDRLAFGLTARQLVILSATALACYLLFTVAATVMPLPAAAAACTPLGLVGVGLALGRRDGLSGDRLALAAARHLSKPRRRVAATEALPAALPGAPVRPAVALLGLPVRAILAGGLVELADGSFCVLAQATGTSFALRAEEEQQALIEAFGRWLNSLTDPVAITVRAEHVDLTEHAAAITQAAGELPSAALRDCASTYATYLGELSSTGGGLSRRQILITLSARAGEREQVQGVLERRASEACALLRDAGVELTLLDGEQAATLLPRILEPAGVPAGSQLAGVVRC